MTAGPEAKVAAIVVERPAVYIRQDSFCSSMSRSIFFTA
ncbi:hypothetical protein VCRA2123E76_70005 [Vibrio crassostreae]|nr:hypothetical protein VCRA2123E76_70005 [Vibrio crassostreae]